MSYTKYPRTMNFHWSDSNSSDDVWWKDAQVFEGKEVVVTEKMDGECTSIYKDHVHARSLDSGHHPSRTMVKVLQGKIGYEIDEGWRICGENVRAFHSILYTDLPSYFLCFGIYDANNLCISWDETEEICQLLELDTVPVLYRGIWDEKLIRGMWTGKGRFPTFVNFGEKPKWPDTFVPGIAEGYVVRLASSFPYGEFRECVAKYVRPNHVTTSQHWMKQEMIPNLLKEIELEKK